MTDQFPYVKDSLVWRDDPFICGANRYRAKERRTRGVSSNQILGGPGLESKSMTPCWENLFSVVSTSNSLVFVLDPWRAFWADPVAFKSQLASCIASGTTEIQGHCHTCRARGGGPGTPLRTTDANLNCVIVENALFCCSKYCEGPGPSRPAWEEHINFTNSTLHTIMIMVHQK